jgi:hypothetical protein
MHQPAWQPGEHSQRGLQGQFAPQQQPADSLAAGLASGLRHPQALAWQGALSVRVVASLIDLSFGADAVASFHPC